MSCRLPESCRHWPALCLSLLSGLVVLFSVPVVRAEALHEEAPRVVAALEQGLAAELGAGLRKNLRLALARYCDAGVMGSPEGFFRVDRILAMGPVFVRNPALANAYFALVDDGSTTDCQRQ